MKFNIEEIVKVEVKNANPKFLNIDQMAFKYYLGYELDEFMISSEITVSKRDIDRLYFKILKRLEPYFNEAPPIKPLNELIEDMQR